MLTMDVREFLSLRRNINVRNVGEFSHPMPVLSSILSQKIVERMKARHPVYLRRLDEIAECWRRRGRVPRWLTAPPMMKAKLLMKSLGYTKAEIRRYSSNPELIEDEDLRRFVWKAVTTDFIYSPIAVKFQRIKGRMGEEMIRRWLEAEGLDFRCEEELRREGGKTPDFLLEKPLKLNGCEIVWIESKAMFGDPVTHSNYWRRQYHEYLKSFGNGLVVYWFGHVEGLFLATIGETFGAFDMRVRVCDDGMEIGDPFTRDFLENMLKLLDLFYEGKELRIRPNRWAERILNLMGFELVADDEPSDF